MKNYILGALALLTIVLAGLLLSQSFGKKEMSKAQVQTQFNDLKTDYELLQNDMEGKMIVLDASGKVIDIQKRKLETLMRKNAITEEELLEAKKIMREISQSVLDNYHTRVADLEKEKLGISNEKIEDEVKLKNLETTISKLQNEQKNITQKYNSAKEESLKKDNLLSYASKLSVSNFVLKSFRVRSSGREVETDKASRIDRIKLSFDISENRLAKAGRKDLYLVVTNPEGKLTTFTGKPSGTFFANGYSKTFSDHVFVNYIPGNNQTAEYAYDGEDFKRGDYILEVYEHTQNGNVLIGKATKTLE